MPSSTPKKFGKKGQVLHSQTREVIAAVIDFMENEAKNGVTIPLANFKKRVIAATGISESSYCRILKESKAVKSGASSSFSTPHKERSRKSSKSTVLEGEEAEIRRIINEFYIFEKRRPSLRTILVKIRECGINFTGGISSLRKLIMKLGFKWQKTSDNRKILMESFDIRLKRVEYLKGLVQYREEGRPIVYTDETYIHSSHTQQRDWSDGSRRNLKTPISKGKRLIIVHAGSEAGFIPNALLIFRSGSKSGDYHSDMNSSNFFRWVETQLIPNLPANSVLVVDNASYHNVLEEKPPTSASSKKVMLDWLTERNIRHDSRMTKPEIYRIIKDNKPRPVYKLDKLLNQYGHKVLRLPPYHPELNPIEKIWATAKNWVATNNVTFKMDDVEKLARRKFENIGVKEWFAICQHVKRIENQYIDKEHVLDAAMDDFVIPLNTADSSEFDSEESDSSSVISGIEQLPDDSE